MNLNPIIMYHGVWYATEKSAPVVLRKRNKEQEQKRINWDAILFALVMLACLIIGGL